MPGEMSPLNPWAAPWQPPARHAQPAGTEDFLSQKPTGHLLELPSEVTACVLGHVGPAPRDVLGAALVCKAMTAALAAASAQLDLSKGPRDKNSQQSIKAMVASLPKYMPGLVRLNLSGLSIEDTDVIQLLQHLPRLEQLQLSSCRKLTGSLTAYLSQLCSQQQQRAGTFPAGRHIPVQHQQGKGAAAVVDTQGCTLQSTATAGSRPSTNSACRLRCLDLQRCFQLRDTALGDVLSAAAHGHMPLQALAFSHLDLSQWPCGVSSSMLIQELQHTRQHTSQEETAPSGERESMCGVTQAAADITQCDMALLTSQKPASVLEASTAALLQRQPQMLPTTHITLLALNNCTGVTLSALWGVARLCPNLQYLMLGGCNLQPATAPNSNSNNSSSVGNSRPEPPHVAMRVAQVLAAVIRMLAHLQAMDLTFCPPGMLAELQQELRSLAHSNVRQQRTDETSESVQLWDFTSTHSAAQALASLEETAASQTQREQQPQRVVDTDNPTSCLRSDAGLRMIMRCGVNCSNAARMSALHVAVELGVVGLVDKLLKLGAFVDVRDKGNNTPLFRAAYHGHLDCARVLLEAGADLQIPNSAGEQPLYIAALRGHTRVVLLLLAACKEQRLPWQDTALYGDGWTPLMAAAVADHSEVCSALLRAAGPPGGHEQVALVSAVNRYGQSALHIAARKASAQLLRLLLSAAGPQPGLACTIMDDNGDTPYDVARKNRNRHAMDVFTRQLQSPLAITVQS